MGGRSKGYPFLKVKYCTSISVSEHEFGTTSLGSGKLMAGDQERFVSLVLSSESHMWWFQIFFMFIPICGDDPI